MLFTDALDLRPVGLWRNNDATGTLHWFSNKGGDPLLPQFGQFSVPIPVPHESVFVRMFIGALCKPVGLVDVMDVVEAARLLRALRPCRRVMSQL